MTTVTTDQTHTDSQAVIPPAAPGDAPHHASVILSTLNDDGSRRWIRPKPSRGRFFRRRRALAYILIAIFTALPYIKIHGRPAVQIDLVHRVFSLFGAVFFPTDTLLLALFMLSVFVTIFLLTALFGRVWCGWACPQTVYMEFLIRPIERFFDGEPGRKPKTGAWRKPAKYATYFLVCLYLAHTFLAYFVGVDALEQWVTQSPLEHPTSFIVMVVVTALMLFDFGFFREQTCLVACPYGRLQSVLLDKNSLIVSYDYRRGEPRGRKKRKKPTGDVSLKVVAEEQQGDCIDCKKCVATCPTGIDIRDGLQMECIHCTQCIDACDEVMEKIGKPRGLIRYGSQAGMAGEKFRLLRPRVVIYPLLLAVLLSGLGFAVSQKQAAEVTILRAGGGMPYFQTTFEGKEYIGTRIKVRVRNRTANNVTYVFSIDNVPGSKLSGADALAVAPFELGTDELLMMIPPQRYGRTGRLDVGIVVDGSDGFHTVKTYEALGPAWLGEPAADTSPSASSSSDDAPPTEPPAADH